jgi:hypothetical protein
MFDPVVVCPTPAPDLFLHLTGAAWTAIGSIVSAASVIALVAYNWKYLRIAREQTLAATTQANVALSTLDSLQRQLLDQEKMERHSVLNIIQHAYANLSLWRDNMKISTAPEQYSIQLLPDTWNLVLIYASRHHPNLSETLSRATQEIRRTQIFLNEVMQTEHRSRGLNSSLKIRVDQIITHLEKWMITLKEIEQIISSSLIPS